MFGLQIDRLPTRYGDMFAPREDAVIGASLRRYGEWAEHEIRVLAGLAREGTTVIDVGANIGTHALAFARRLPDCAILAVEPQPLAFSLMCATLAVNEVRNVDPMACACGRETGVAQVCFDYGAPGLNMGAFVLHAARNEAARRAPVAIARLDDLAPDADVSLVKIDVEGMEADVLAGARALLARCRPFVYFEVLSMDGLRACLPILRDLGYELRWLETSAFNAENFRGETENIWWLGETGVVAAPSTDDPRLAALPLATGEEAEPPRRAFAKQEEEAIPPTPSQEG